MGSPLGITLSIILTYLCSFIKSIYSLASFSALFSILFPLHISYHLFCPNTFYSLFYYPCYTPLLSLFTQPHGFLHSPSADMIGFFSSVEKTHALHSLYLVCKAAHPPVLIMPFLGCLNIHLSFVVLFFQHSFSSHVQNLSNRLCRFNFLHKSVNYLWKFKITALYIYFMSTS